MMGRTMELLSLLSGGQRGWLDAAMVLSFFWIAVARPERIANILRFRIACILFALSILTPALINLYLFSGGGSNLFGGMGGRGGDPGAGIYLQIATPALQMLSFLLGIDSVMPRKTPQTRLPPGPPPPLQPSPL